jgi:hypothetical protein
MPISDCQLPICERPIAVGLVGICIHGNSDIVKTNSAQSSSRGSSNRQSAIGNRQSTIGNDICQ